MTLARECIEAAAQEQHDAYLRHCAQRDLPVKPEYGVRWEALTEVAQDIDRATAKAAIRAFLRTLRDRGPSEGMKCAGFAAMNDCADERAAADSFSAMLAELIREIEEER